MQNYKISNCCFLYKFLHKACKKHGVGFKTLLQDKMRCLADEGNRKEGEKQHFCSSNSVMKGLTIQWNVIISFHTQGTFFINCWNKECITYAS